MFEWVAKTAFRQIVSEKVGRMLGEALGVDDCAKQRTLGGEQSSLLLGTEDKGEKWKENSGAVVLDLDGLSLGLPTPVGPFAGQSVTILMKLVYFF